jgi:hypothetical protein
MNSNTSIRQRVAWQMEWHRTLELYQFDSLEYRHSSCGL